MIGAVALCPVASFAESESCSGYAPTFPSNYSQEAFNLLQSVKNDAQQVSDDVTKLRELANDRDVDWGIQALALARIQSKVNDLKERLCRLNVTQFVITGWERKAIAEVGPKVVAMTTDTNRALEHVKHHEGALWSEAYRTCMRNLSDETAAVKNRIAAASSFGRLEHVSLKSR